MFGRGGEEIEALARAGVAVEVVPGVTAALGCAASAGIPLTHRDHAQACVFVTGHLKRRQRRSRLADAGAAAPDRRHLHGRERAAGDRAPARRRTACRPSTPVALIENGTTDRERRVVGTLATIERQAMRAQLQGPTLCMVGEVVGLAMAQSGAGKAVNFSFESRMGL